MDFELSERQIVYILNALSFYLQVIKWHTPSEKKRIQEFFDLYREDYDRLIILHRLISINANIKFYDVHDSEFFIRQRKYLIK